MRKIMMAVAALALSGGAAWGQSASQTVNLTATVGGYCTFEGTTGTARNALVTISNAKATTGSTVSIDGSSASITCTSNSKITMTSANGGLTNIDPLAVSAAGNALSAFVNKIHYTATANYNSATDTIQSDTNSGSLVTTLGTDTTGAVTGGPLTLGISIKATPTNKLLFNGTYTDTLTVTVSPRA